MTPAVPDLLYAQDQTSWKPATFLHHFYVVHEENKNTVFLFIFAFVKGKRLEKGGEKSYGFKNDREQK